MRPLIAAFAAVALSGCVTTNISMAEGSTTITTSPAGARVFINGAEVCSTTPCNWAEGDGIPHRFHLQVRKEGFREIDLYLDKELRIFNGLFSPVGWQMPRQVSLTMEQLPGAPPPPVPPPGQPAPPAPSL